MSHTVGQKKDKTITTITTQQLLLRLKSRNTFLNSAKVTTPFSSCRCGALWGWSAGHVFLQLKHVETRWWVQLATLEPLPKEV